MNNFYKTTSFNLVCSLRCLGIFPEKMIKISDETVEFHFILDDKFEWGRQLIESGKASVEPNKMLHCISVVKSIIYDFLNNN